MIGEDDNSILQLIATRIVNQLGSPQDIVSPGGGSLFSPEARASSFTGC
jgi:hypothetical protein